MTPQDQHRAIRSVAASLERLPGLQGIPGGDAFIRDLLRRAEADLRRPVVFRHVGQDAAGRDSYQLGREGGEIRAVVSRCPGVWATWWALDDTGRSGTLRASDLVGVDCENPGKVARTMIRRTAAAQFAAWGAPELEAAALACRVVEGVITLELPANAPRFITR